MNKITRSIAVNDYMSKEIIEEVVNRQLSYIGETLTRMAINTNDFIFFKINIEKSNNPYHGKIENYNIVCLYGMTHEESVHIIKYEDMSWDQLSHSAIREIWRRIKRLFKKR